MSSKKPSDATIFSLDLPTTQRDVEALRRARRAGERSFAEALDRLSKLDHLPARERSVSRGWEEFVLD